MADIVFCNKPMNASELKKQYDVDIAHFNGLGDNNTPSTLSPYQPYLLGQAPSDFDRSIFTYFNMGAVARNLTNLSLSFGAENTLALAHISEKLEKLKHYGLETAGTAAELYRGRVDGFTLAVKKYQDAVLAYRDIRKSNSAIRVLARQKLLSAHQEMQTRFKFEMQAVTSASKARKGISLTSPTRAMNIAKSSRNITKLNLVDQIEASRLVKYAKGAKFVGNGLAVLNFGAGVADIRKSYKSGENWEKEMFVESSSFAASAAVGSVAVGAGEAVLTFLLVATPVGWLGLIWGGCSCHRSNGSSRWCVYLGR